MSDHGGLGECLWDLGEARMHVRGMVKSLIQARWQAEPGYLTDEQVIVWFPPAGTEVGGNGRSARTLLAGHLPRPSP
jgi:hypothetical protein